MSFFAHRPQHQHNNPPKVLFILKRREDYNDCPSYSQNEGLSTGLLNSATFVKDMLVENDIEAKIVVVIDNNDIDKAVTKYKPTHVIIEALWVVPEKFTILSKLHPKVKWIVRFHSETPFIANEGIAMGWIHGYSKQPNVYIGINTPRYLFEMETILAAAGIDDDRINDRLVFLPNYYPVPNEINISHIHPNKTYVDISSFGAIRPLKNQLIQAIAALKFADTIGKALHFHVNVGRVEMKGDPILHNLKDLFEGIKDNGHRLIIHTWTDHKEFMKLIKEMDIGMQVSFSETFNIVAADTICGGVPIVVSSEVPWAKEGIASPTNSAEIAHVLYETWESMRHNVTANVKGLRHYVDTSAEFWKDFLSRKNK